MRKKLFAVIFSLSASMLCIGQHMHEHSTTTQKSSGVEPQPLLAQAIRLKEALSFLGSALSKEDEKRLEALRDKQVEILRRTLSDLETIAKQLANTSTQPPFNANEVVQRALHNALADMQDIARTTQQTQAEAYALVSKRMEDALRELKASIEKPKT